MYRFRFLARTFVCVYMQATAGCNLLFSLSFVVYFFSGDYYVGPQRPSWAFPFFTPVFIRYCSFFIYFSVRKCVCVLQWKRMIYFTFAQKPKFFLQLCSLSFLLAGSAVIELWIHTIYNMYMNGPHNDDIYSNILFHPYTHTHDFFLLSIRSFVRTFSSYKQIPNFKFVNIFHCSFADKNLSFQRSIQSRHHNNNNEETNENSILSLER